MRLRSFLPYAGIAAVAVALDQWIKGVVESTLAMQDPVPLLPFLALYRTYNTGVAFSMLSFIGDFGLIVLSLCVAAFVVTLALRAAPHQWVARLGFALILGGAIGNVIDRTLYGHVIDYILFHTPVWSFAVFNLADAFITVGAALVILEEFWGWRREREKSAAAND